MMMMKSLEVKLEVKASPCSYAKSVTKSLCFRLTLTASGTHGVLFYLLLQNHLATPGNQLFKNFKQDLSYFLSCSGRLRMFEHLK